jgi:hypothetical protein
LISAAAVVAIFARRSDVVVQGVQVVL